MAHTTTLRRLGEIVPESETHWREIAARAHRTLKRPGDEAAAKTHELHIHEIRQGVLSGTSRLGALPLCPRCLQRGAKYVLIFVDGGDRCGTCDWPGRSRLEADEPRESRGDPQS